ncbi:MAG TPA: hypothetical protein VGJ60_17725 [Chloroflexota bacterium]|jgi:hypothetical protein
MNQTHGLVTALVRGARWGFPWLCILTISGTAAYAMTAALALSDQPMSFAVEQAPATGSATNEGALITWIDLGVELSASTLAVSREATPDAAGLATDDACAASGPRLYVGLNTWIHDPTVPCRDDGP